MADCKPTHNCANCPSRQTTEWRDLSVDELKMVTRAKQTQTLDPGDTLYDQGDEGDGIFCIQSGLIGLRRLDEDGNSILLKLCSGGTTVGYRSFLSKQAHLNLAEVLNASVVCHIERPAVVRLLERNPRLGERFLRHAMEDLTAAEEAYAQSLTKSMKARFLHALMVLYERLGYQDESGHAALDLPIKRMELAELIGAQPESISRLIRSVESEGLLQIDDRRIQFRDMDAVLRHAGAQY